MMFRVFGLSLSLLGCLAACETLTEPSVDAAAAPAGKTSNLRPRGNDPSPPLRESAGEKQPLRLIGEDEATQTLLDTAEKMAARGDLTSAGMIYRRAVASNPKSIAARTGLARMSEAENRPREALKAWRAIAAAEQDNAEAQRGIGRSLMALGLYPAAIRHLERARKLGGEGGLRAANLLAMAQIRNGDGQKAIQTLTGALKEHDDLNTRNNLGFAYVMTGKLGMAIPILEDIIKDSKATVQHRQNLALAYGLAGREDDARALALQDLPPKAVANNLKAYRALRAKLRKEKAKSVAGKNRKNKKKKAKKAKAPKPAPVIAKPAGPAPKPPEAAPASPVEARPVAPAENP